MQSFRHAFAGWHYMIKTQPNAKIHALISVAVFVLALWLDLTARDWAIVIVIAVVVWSSEFINTAIEAAVDLNTTDPHPLAKVAKDVAAAAVLLAALGAVIVGFLILGPPLWRRLF
jgi:diacylglycerol kinase